MQLAHWRQEYADAASFPSTRALFPSKAVKRFLSAKIQPPGRALDIGSGNGRNAIYAAECGYEVVGLEFVQEAIALAGCNAAVAGVENRVEFRYQNAGDRWPFPDASFDLVVDMMTLHLLNDAERKIYWQELHRVLKPQGYYLLYTLAADSDWGKKLLKDFPGPEPGTYELPQNHQIERPFTRAELSRDTQPWTEVYLEQRYETVEAFDREWSIACYHGLWQKPGAKQGGSL